MAAEITGPSDPFVPPSLVGNTPGWPTTDLRIINDNNKAQRNMGLSTTPARGVGASDCYFATVRNAATFPRDLELRYEVNPAVAKKFKGAAIEVIGGKDIALAKSGILRLAGMQPGENRWIGLRFPAAAGKVGQVLAVDFHEVVEGVVVNGFAIGAKLGTADQVMREKLQRHRSELTRLAASGVENAADSAARAAKLATTKKIAPQAYMKFVAGELRLLAVGVKVLGSASQSFRLAASLKSLTTAVKSGKADAVAVCHDCLLNRFDSALTMQQVAGGDVANILHNVRWQLDLFRTLPRLSRTECAPRLVWSSESFVQSYGARRALNRDYPKLVRTQLECLAATAKVLADKELFALVTRLEQNVSGDLARLQKAHQDYLERLDGLARV
jgi:hypothetical protein